MGAIVVMLEREEPLIVRALGGGRDLVEDQGVEKVHAAPSDPDIPEDPGPQTFCGLDTSTLTKDPWSPPGPGSTWYPPRWHDRVCRRCATALRSL